MASDQFAEFRSAPDETDKLDLDALLAIVRRRTCGDLDSSDLHEWLSLESKTAIVTAVNNFEAIAERCKRAEETRDSWIDHAAKTGADNMELTRQRDELLAMLRRVADYSWNQMTLEMQRSVGDCIASVKGGADGKAVET